MTDKVKTKQRGLDFGDQGNCVHEVTLLVKV